MIQRTWSQISEEEVNQFEAADFKGWESLEKEFKAVKVWKGEEAARLRSMYPDWIGSKAKANSWTLSVQCKIQVLRAWSQGSGQRDLQDICTDLSTEALNMVCQVVANEDLLSAFGDIKGSLCPVQSVEKTTRSSPCGRTYQMV